MNTEALAGLPLAEHFVIVGLHPLDSLRFPALSSVYQSSLWAGKGKAATRTIPGTYPPQILYTYPPSRPLLSAHQMPDFCFPSGMAVSCVKRTDSGSSLNHILYGQSFRNTSSQLHVFHMVGDGGRTLFGICITKIEFVESLPSFLSSPPLPPPPTNVEVSSSFFSLKSERQKCHVVAPRCYCILSYFPYFRLHFEYLFSLLGQEQIGRLHLLEVEIEKEREEAERKKRLLSLAPPHPSSSSISSSSSSVSSPAPARPFAPTPPSRSTDHLSKERRRSVAEEGVSPNKSLSFSATLPHRTLTHQVFSSPDLPSLAASAVPPQGAESSHLSSHLSSSSPPSASSPETLDQFVSRFIDSVLRSAVASAAFSSNPPTPLPSSPSPAHVINLSLPSSLLSRISPSPISALINLKASTGVFASSPLSLLSSFSAQTPSSPSPPVININLPPPATLSDTAVLSSSNVQSNVTPENSESSHVNCASPRTPPLPSASSPSPFPSPSSPSDSSSFFSSPLPSSLSPTPSSSSPSSTAVSATPNPSSPLLLASDPPSDVAQNESHTNPESDRNSINAHLSLCPKPKRNDDDSPPLVTEDDDDSHDRVTGKEKEVTITMHRDGDLFPATEDSALANVIAKESSVDKVKGDDVIIDDVRRLLSTYFALSIPREVTSMDLQMPVGLASLSLRSPAIRQEFWGHLSAEGTLIAEWCLPIALRVLSVPNILLIFSAVLLEKQILVVCPNPCILSLVVLAIVSLVRPFVWQGLCAPVLPSRMLDLLDAPVPFVFGVQSLPHRRVAEGTLWDRTNWEGMTIFVDTNTVQVPSGLQVLPEGKKLESKLKAKCGRAYVAGSASTSHPSSMNAADLDAVNEVCGCLLQYTLWFSRTISSTVIEAFKEVFGPNYTASHFRTSTMPTSVPSPSLPPTSSSSSTESSPSSSSFASLAAGVKASLDEHRDYKEKKQMATSRFLRKVAPMNRPFVSHFINTQMFAAYCETREKQENSNEMEAEKEKGKEIEEATPSVHTSMAEIVNASEKKSD